MHIALYDLDHGYYRKSHIGKAGDFFTSVSVGPLFGQMLAYYLANELARLAGPVQIVEAGANDGALAVDILSWLAQKRPEIAKNVRYFIIEPIRELQERQREKLGLVRTLALPVLESVRWVETVEELPAVRGAIICNELLDAFPVHVFRWQRSEERWREYGVDSRLEFAPMEEIAECAMEALLELKPLEPHLPDGFTVEFSPAAEAWWRSAAGKLSEGLMVAFDYGDEATGLWAPGRAQGTLRAYRAHKLVSDVLADPGEQDITASVNFTRIRRAGEAAGLRSEPLQTQAQFLTKIAGEFFDDPAGAEALAGQARALPAEVRQFQTLTHPEHLGRAFKVLVQSRINS